MAGKGKKFFFHGSFKSKAKAKKHEHLAHCFGCFMLEKKTHGEGSDLINKRYLVLQPKRRKL